MDAGLLCSKVPTIDATGKPFALSDSVVDPKTAEYSGRPESLGRLADGGC